MINNSSASYLGFAMKFNLSNLLLTLLFICIICMLASWQSIGMEFEDSTSPFQELIVACWEWYTFEY